MIKEGLDPPGTIVRYDRRTIVYSNQEWEHLAGLTPAPKEWGFIIEYLRGPPMISRARVLWNNGIASNERTWTLCVHKDLEKQRKRLNA